MDQGKLAYYAELIFYPALISGFFIIKLLSDRPALLVLLPCALLGISLWTIVEYLLHRFAFDELPGVAQLHALHHARPSAFIGTPLWVSLTLFTALVFLPLWRITGFEIATGTTSGLILGYVWYLLIHDAVHRWSLNLDSWLSRAKYRHLLHHRSTDGAGNFSVTTGFWDAIFRTRIAVIYRNGSRHRRRGRHL